MGLKFGHLGGGFCRSEKKNQKSKKKSKSTKLIENVSKGKEDGGYLPSSMIIRNYFVSEQAFETIKEINISISWGLSLVFADMEIFATWNSSSGN